MSKIEIYNIETRISVEYEQEITREIIEIEDKYNSVSIINETVDAIRNYKNVRTIKSRKHSCKSVLSHDDEFNIKKENFQIAISQSGRFVATFDTGKISLSS
jgi:hypothetical protein